MRVANMSRPFRFDTDKAIQSVAFLLRLERDHRTNYMRLLKLLYIAEREILAEAGVTITGSRTIAMERGPVLEDVYSLIRSQHTDTAAWSKFFQVSSYDLEMIDDPGVGKLPKFIAEKLEEVSKRHSQHDEWALVEITHQFPEWKKNDPGKSSKPIALADILDGMGRGETLPQVLDGAKQEAFLSSFFTECR